MDSLGMTWWLQPPRIHVTSSFFSPPHYGFSWPQLSPRHYYKFQTAGRRKEGIKKKGGGNVYIIYLLWPLTKAVPFIRCLLMPAVENNLLFILPHWNNNIHFVVLLQHIIQGLAQ